MGELLSSFITLLCAILASLTIGVLIAHAICVAMFSVFRIHRQSVAAARTSAKTPATSLEPQRN
jgi:MFS superfamily sulfate permease-like transporter